MFSFFPLAKYFDYQNEDHWHSLSDNIQYTLLETGGKEKQLQSEFGDLMLDFFWMSFVAAYPSFPGRMGYMGCVHTHEWDIHYIMAQRFWTATPQRFPDTWGSSSICFWQAQAKHQAFLHIDYLKSVVPNVHQCQWLCCANFFSHCVMLLPYQKQWVVYSAATTQQHIFNIWC